MESLGIDIKTIGLQIVNFGILVFVLNKFLYKPVLKAIKTKNQEIDEINKQKEDIVKSQESAVANEALLVQKAESQKTEVLKEAKLEVAKLKKEAKEEAEKKALALIEKAKKDIDSEKEKLSADFEKEVLAAAFAINEKVLGKMADKKAVEAAYKSMGKVKSALWRN